MSTLVLEGVRAGYDGAAVIRDLNLRVGPGELVAMMGPNGAGKTTTMRVISGSLSPFSGTVSFAGEDVTSVSTALRARRGMAHVPEDRGIFPGLTVAEHFRLSYRGEQLDADEAYNSFPALQELRGRRAGLLSGGEQQMLALGRAMARHPKLLLIDELSHGLAPVIVQRILPVLSDYAARTQAAVLLVEQHVQLAVEVADRGYVLSHGQLVLEQNGAELKQNRELLVASYLGESNVSASDDDFNKQSTGGQTHG